jgi:aminoglycoside phosphotransferase
MTFDHIIIQAGGKGTRLGQLTRNKPKGIVPFENMPIIFHLFRLFSKKKFIIIGDYLHDTLERYLEAFTDVRYLTVNASGTGTCGGIAQAVSYIPDDTPFLLIWSDLILPSSIDFDDLPDADYIGLSKDFECRWSYKCGIFTESPSRENGVAGFFIFRNKKALAKVPESGELVRYFSDNGLYFNDFSLKGTIEIGTLASLNELKKAPVFRCRPFNRIEIEGDVIIKIPVDAQGKKLAVRESAWYHAAEQYHFDKIPEIISFDPLRMKRIKGEHIFRAQLDDKKKKLVIDSIIASLRKLHDLKHVVKDIFSIKEAYYTKTMNRLAKVRNLIPFSDRKMITINGNNYRNIYFYTDVFQKQTENILYNTDFAFIHGDCTFSNIMVNENGEITFLDPRGYFGFIDLYGDTAYDWAKVFYSINGDYDQFNNSNFTLVIGKESVSLEIATNGWKHLSDYYISNITDCTPERIRFIHAIIWLSLTTYAWDDYDSICGAFYNGLMLMDEFLKGGAND